ncbi:MAG: cytochrome c oxidase subunit I [Ignavibacteria bacterium GWF2_33_9]|nr:MAG: cytochrome c oxidase subunit I [Ignavibacteria bacterium GWF2_33_9]
MGKSEFTFSHDNYLNNNTGKSNLMSWLTTTDHKRIGLMYLYGMIFFFGLAMLIGVVMKLEMLTPGKTLIDAQTYNAFFTLHGMIMIFLFIIPGIPAVLGNFIMPIQIGAKDVIFPRLNLMSWYFYIFGGIFAIASLFLSGGPIDTGWTFYVPYSIRTNTNVILPLLGAFIIGFSGILTGINFVTTIHRLRAKGMTFFRLPLFVWAIYATAWIQIIATPVVGITIVLVIVERLFSIGIFDPALGGDPLLFQHLFWIYSHPAVYIMILPAMGIVSEIIPTFAKRTIFGYKMIAYSSLAIAFIGYFVWAHHMFNSGISDLSRMIFSLITFLVAIPSGIKVFNWVATLYKGSIVFKTPLFYVAMFIFLFSIGGLTGMITSSLATDVHISDTYFLVAHFHYTMFGGVAIIMIAGLHYWLPKMYGRMYNEKLAMWSGAIIFVGFNLMYFTMFILGYQGMPRRFWSYLPQYQTLHIVSVVGMVIFVMGMIVMAYNLIRGARKGPIAPANPWGGVTLEWRIPSPPPTLNFDKDPVVTREVYDFTNPDDYGLPKIEERGINE